jgi:ABC-type phosphate transport system substrate-binding protein
MNPNRLLIASAFSALALLGAGCVTTPSAPNKKNAIGTVLSSPTHYPNYQVSNALLEGSMKITTLQQLEMLVSESTANFKRMYWGVSTDQTFGTNTSTVIQSLIAGKTPVIIVDRPLTAEESQAFGTKFGSAPATFRIAGNPNGPMIPATATSPAIPQMFYNLVVAGSTQHPLDPIVREYLLFLLSSEGQGFVNAYNCIALDPRAVSEERAKIAAYPVYQRSGKAPSIY